MSVACRVVCSGVRCVGSVSDVSVSVPTHVSAWCRMCRVVSDPTHLCRIGVGWCLLGVGLVSDRCRMCRVASDPTHLCRIGVGLVSDVSGGVGCVGGCRNRHICVGLVSDPTHLCQIGVGSVNVQRQFSKKTVQKVKKDGIERKG